MLRSEFFNCLAVDELIKRHQRFVPPMMAQSAKEPFDSRDWIFEVKLDGYRAITVFDASGKPHLWSRNGLPLEQKFPAISKAVSRLKLRSTVLDGEIVAVDENGIPRFSIAAAAINSDNGRFVPQRKIWAVATSTFERGTDALI
jgi:ATP-dependent DNA ligase